MKNEFKEYHLFNEGELKQLWEDAIFVFDANTLLNMYRYSRETVKEYLEALQQLKDDGRLWLPYQAGYEFYENRLNVIAKYSNSYDEILNEITKFKDNVGNQYSNHPFVDVKKIRESIDTKFLDIVKDIEDQKDKHPNWIKDDEVLGKLNAIFENATGKPYSEEELEKIYAEGEERYKNNIPPGYKDAVKGGTRQYGDLVLWKSMIQKAEETQKPIIFVSGDVKEDWWMYHEGEKLMPRSELKREIRKLAGVDFHIYTAYNFLDHFGGGEKKNTKKVSDNTIDEVKRITEIQEKHEHEHVEMPEIPKFFYGTNTILDDAQLYELAKAMFDLSDYINSDEELREISKDLFAIDIVLKKVIPQVNAKNPVNQFYKKKLVSYIGKLKVIARRGLIKMQMEGLDDRELQRLVNIFESVIERM